MEHQLTWAGQKILADLFLDLGESSYEDCDYQQSDVVLAFMNQRMLAVPDETRHIWQLDGPLEDAHGLTRCHVLQASRSPGCCRFQR